MADTTHAGQDSQKTVVAFIVGLIIGGLLVWVFTDTPQPAPTDTTDETTTEETDNGGSEAATDTGTNAATDADTPEPTTAPAAELPTGDGEVVVNNQPAGTVVTLERATFPQDNGWIGVRDFLNGQPGALLGVVRFSKEQGLVPESVTLQRATVAGNEYAVVFYTESGDREFSLADDVQVAGVFATFTAQ